MHVNISTAGKEYLDPAADMMAEVFKTDPALTFLLSSLSDSDRPSYLRSYLRSLFMAATLNSGVIEKINDWESCAIWVPPGRRIDTPLALISSGFLGVMCKIGPVGIKRMLVDFQKQANESKRKLLLKHKKWHYLFFMGTALRARGKGLATEVIRRHQVRAQEDNLPIWLEATTPHSRDIYARSGFEVVHEMWLGEGTHDANGLRQKGGSGFGAWAMIWEPRSVEGHQERASPGHVAV